MNNGSSTARADRFHEWPLVAFTTLAVMGAGLLATPLLAWVAAGTPAPAAGAVRWGAVLMAAGLAVSLAHLGRPRRAHLALAGLGRSRLSAEVAAASLATLLGGATALLPYVSPILDVAAAAAGMAFLVTLGLVYRLPGQHTWRGAVVWMPLSSAIGFGAVALAAIWGEAVVAIGAVAAVALAADAALVVIRRLSLAWPAAPLAPKYPRVFARGQLLLAGRFGLVDILPGAFLLAGLPGVATALLGLGVLLDRVSFYGLASQQTTDAEIARIERSFA